MSLEGDCPRTASGSLISVEKQEGPLATGGRPVTLVSMAALGRLSGINMAVMINHREGAFVFI